MPSQKYQFLGKIESNYYYLNNITKTITILIKIHQNNHIIFLVLRKIVNK